MEDFLIRTEDIATDRLLQLFVETSKDRDLVNALKGQNPVILVGSRGVGKSFLLKVACAELVASFGTGRIFPVYVNFTKSSLVQFARAEQFQHWMFAKICSAILRGLGKEGLLAKSLSEVSILAGERVAATFGKTKLETVEEAFETSWRTPGENIDIAAVPDIDTFKNALEDLCHSLKIRRFALFIDEAAHVFLPQQQRQFFTLFRDLRSPYLTCNAAIYPGVTSFGDTFQAAHDATFLNVDRDVLGVDYVNNMREIVEKQADSETLKSIERNGQNFAVLAYAASGNPRLLLKTLTKARKVNSSDVNDAVRTFYRSEIWTEHSILAEKYPGHKALIDWGRYFIESHVLPQIQQKNIQYLVSEKNTSAFFWISREAPIAVKHALQILSYTGIVSEHSKGIKTAATAIGTRYSVNIGCLFSLEKAPASTAFEIAKALSVRRSTEFGPSHDAYAQLADITSTLEDEAVNREALMHQLKKSADVLDITDWQKSKLAELKLSTIEDVLRATENDLKKADYVGDVRARQMRNAAEAAVFEYLSG